jgi:hypothetical protein
MSTLVSKNTLSRIRFYSVKDESRRQGTAQFPQATERLSFALIAPHLEDSLAGWDSYATRAVTIMQSDCRVTQL